MNDNFPAADFIQRSGLVGAGIAAAQMLPLRFLQAQTAEDARQPARALSEPRLGEALSQPIRLRPLVLLGLRAERHAQLPHHRARPQRRHRPARRGIRHRHLLRPLRQQGHGQLGQPPLRQGLHVPPHSLRAVSAQASHRAPRLEALGRRRLSRTDAGGEGEIQVRLARHGQVRAHLLGRRVRLHRAKR